MPFDTASDDVRAPENRAACLHRSNPCRGQSTVMVFDPPVHAGKLTAAALLTVFVLTVHPLELRATATRA